MNNATHIPKIGQDHQTRLAKLLAKENLNIQVGNFSTAWFDPNSRTLGLPTWNTKEKHVSDLLVGHEVGHALFTPENGVARFRERFPDTPFDVCNIVEDIRIERKIQENYPGIAMQFRRGYANFLENNFFGVKDKNLAEMRFIDRLNLKGKVGTQLEVPLDDDEQAIYDRCYAAEDFEEVLDIIDDIRDLIRAKKETEHSTLPQDSLKESESGDGESNPSPGDESAPGESGESNPSPGDESAPGESGDESAPGESGESGESGVSNPSPGDESTPEDEGGKIPSRSTNSPASDNPSPGTSEPIDISNDLKSDTEYALNENTQNLQSPTPPQFGGGGVNSFTTSQLLASVIPFKIVNEARNRDIWNAPCGEVAALNIERINSDWATFKKSSLKTASTLAGEFSRRQAAYRYSRATTSPTGTIDPLKLHKYKIDDQIFKSITTLADGKSHGLVMTVDWSGSMTYVARRVVEQVIQLVQFCKLVSIPFEVYIFTTPSPKADEVLTPQRAKSPQPKWGSNINMERAMVAEVLNSSMKKREFETACKEWWIQAGGGIGYCNYFRSSIERFNGTPLYEALVIMNAVVDRFKTKHKLQKPSLIMLSDGDGHRMHVTSTQPPHRQDDEAARRRPSLNRTTVTSVAYKHHRVTNVDHSKIQTKLVQLIKTVTGASVTCFFISENPASHSHQVQRAVKTARNLEHWQVAVESKTLIRDMKKKNENVVVIPGAWGYDGYFVFQTRQSDDVTVDVAAEIKTNADSTMKKRDINKLAKTYTKQMCGKLKNRSFVTKFAEIIA